jgi:hypothetical protein
MASGNGKPTTTVGALSSLSEKLVSALPPALTFLIILNILFMGVAAWVFQHNTEIRNVMITKIIDTCLQHKDNSP